MLQTTIKLPVEISGIGLHSGIENRIRLSPAPPNTGILFRYKDTLIQANINNVCNSFLCSSISNGRYKIYTIEHLLATLYALKIDNVIVETEKEEIPILDGSSILFTQKILESGIRFLDAPRKRLIIRNEILHKQNDSFAVIRPSNLFIIRYTIEFNSKLIGKQSYSIEINPRSFIEEIAPARTFCEYKDIEKMRSMGLIKGGSLENAIVVEDMRILNEKPLRFINEFVRHKILDAIGDIALIGYEVIGEFEFYKAGHRFNHNFVKNLLLNPSNYELVETDFDDPQEKKRYLWSLSMTPNLANIEK